MTDFPENFALSFWLSGKGSDAILLQTAIQEVFGQAGFAGYIFNWMPLIWLGDAVCNVQEIQPMDPVGFPFVPNYSWAAGIFKTVGSSGVVQNSVGIKIPYANELEQDLMYDTYESDQFFADSNMPITREPTGFYGWNWNRPNHILIDVRKICVGHDWGVRCVVSINGNILVVKRIRQVPIQSGEKRLHLGMPEIPLTAAEEVVIEDLRIYDTAMQVPPIDGTSGQSWAWNSSLGFWAIAQELAYGRGRDRLGVPLYMHVPFMSLSSQGGAYPLGSQFYDTTGRVRFTALTSGSLLSQAPVSGSVRPILGRGRDMAPNRAVALDVTFQGLTDSSNQTFDAWEGTFCEGTIGPQNWRPGYNAAPNVTASGADYPEVRIDPTLYLTAAKIT